MAVLLSLADFTDLATLLLLALPSVSPFVVFLLDLDFLLFLSDFNVLPPLPGMGDALGASVAIMGDTLGVTVGNVLGVAVGDALGGLLVIGP